MHITLKGIRCVNSPLRELTYSFDQKYTLLVKKDLSYVGNVS